MRRASKTIYLSIILLILSISLVLISYLFANIKTSPQTIQVISGENLSNISEKLYIKGLLKYPAILNIYGIASFKARRIKAGEYLINDQMSIVNLIDNMVKGDVYFRDFRIKEGSTFSSLIDEMKKKDFLINDLGKEPFNNIKEKLNIEYTNAEGLFAPDTYYYKYGDTYSNLLSRAYKKQTKILNKLWSIRSLSLPYADKYELLILASIIEKEGTEKDKIAGVFLRRLKLNMKLQTDPTVIYALGDNYDGNIKKKDLSIKHPYNTYYIKGLPPGPICFPSESSLIASSELNNENSLYFVAKGDGTHAFSDTYKDHLKAVKKYQLNK